MTGTHNHLIQKGAEKDLALAPSAPGLLRLARGLEGQHETGFRAMDPAPTRRESELLQVSLCAATEGVHQNVRHTG